VCALLVALRRRVHDRALADLGVCALAIGSGVLAATNVMSGHALAALGCALAFALALPTRAGTLAEQRAARIAGFALSVAVGSEYPSALAALPIAALFVALRPARERARVVGELVLGAAPVAILVAVAHTAMFGAPWRTGYSFLENATYDALVSGFFGIGVPHVDALVMSFLSPELGLLWFAPVTLVGVVVLARPWLAPPVRAAAIVVLVAFALFIAGFKGWRGGWSVGPRYILELVGVLTVCAVVGLDRAARASAVHLSRARAALGASAGAGLVTAGLAGAFFPHLPEVFRNPVRELVLPLVARGFAPDSWPLFVGMSPRASGVLIIAALAAPLVMVALGATMWSDGAPSIASGSGPVPRASRLPARAAQLWAMIGGALTALVVVAVVPARDVDASGAELRRMFDNWRPDGGNAILARAAQPSDPRVQIAIDRGRFVWRDLVGASCVRAPNGTAPSGPLAPFVAHVPAGALVVVADRHAADIARVTGANALVVSFTDVVRHARLGLPCLGPIVVVAPKDVALPAPLQRLRITARADGVTELARTE
jgi:hypothetical protein